MSKVRNLVTHRNAYKTVLNAKDYVKKLPLTEIQPKRIIPLRGYIYLPGNHDQGMPRYAEGPRENFPYAVGCKSDFKYTLEDWGKIARDVLDTYIPTYGAVLFRGLPVHCKEEFSKFMHFTNYETMDYKFGSDHRAMVSQDIFSSSQHASSLIMEMHTEGAYRPEGVQVFRKIIFYCKKPAISRFGGETPICRISDIAERLKPSFLQKLKTKKVTYYIKMAHPNQDPSTNWKVRMNVEDEKGAETKMKELGVNWKWNTNGSVTYWHTRSAFIQHPDTGKDILFNQVTTHHKSYCDHVSTNNYYENWEDYSAGKHVTYGDGEEIEEENIQDYRNAQWNTSVAVPLQAGDILFMDNLDVQHGRMNFHGERELFISIVAD